MWWVPKDEIIFTSNLYFFAKWGRTHTGWVPGCTGWLPGCTGRVPGCTGGVPVCTGWLPGCTGWVPVCTGWVPGCTGWVSGCTHQHFDSNKFIGELYSDREYLFNYFFKMK